MSAKESAEALSLSQRVRTRALPFAGAMALAVTGAMAVAPGAMAQASPTASAHTVGQLPAAVRSQVATQVASQVKFTGSDSVAGDQFGDTVASDGDLLLVGAPQATVNGNAQEGAVYVFLVYGFGSSRRVLQVDKATEPNGQAGDQFGQALAVSPAGVVAIGAPGATVGTTPFPGAVYEYSIDLQGRMIRSTTLTSSDGQSGDSFGRSVAIASNGTTIVGAPNADNNAGALYQFPAPSGKSGVVTQSAEMTAVNGQYGDGLGVSVAITGSTIIAGAPQASVGTGQNQGAAYVFPIAGAKTTSETSSTVLSASDGIGGDQFGVSVAASGSTVAVGAENASATSPGSGAVYEFTQPAKGFTSATQTAKLIFANGLAGPAAMGTSVAVSGNEIVAGAPTATVGKNPFQGEVAEFAAPKAGFKGTVTPTAILTDASGVANDSLGQSVSISSAGYIFAGATDANNAQGAGIAFNG